MSFNFNNKYEQKDFLRFLRNDFLKDFFDEKIEQTSINNKIFNKITKLGVCENLNNLIVLEIEHNSKNDARITITKELFKLLKQYDLNGETYKNALVIFINKESTQYRFSLLTTTYNEDYEEKLSNPKRFSFLLGPNEKVKTVKEFLEKKGSIENFDDLVKRFDVEVVRKEFFNNYLDLYIRLYREIIKDEEFAKNLKTQNIDLVSFTKTLLGKIIFLYFIQKKGWLGVEKDGEYGKNGDKDFMRNLWNDFKNNTEKTVWEKTGFFYNDYLEHLFYEGLNKDNRQENDLNNYFNFKVPYLNGGLFKKDYENWNTNRARISNEIFSNSKQTGILDVFDTYNFTIDEDDLYDKEVAIDPEMLGKIFEKMISISEENIGKILEEFNKNEESGKKAKLEIDNVLNKKLGAFYTPREIVHYMTKESLIAYLVNNLKGKKEENETKIRKVFDYKEKFLTIHEVNLEKEFNEVGEIIEDVIDKLDKIKILDPAIGSGAFPMGLLHEIYTLKYYIFDVFYREFDMLGNEEVKEFIGENEKISVYKIKKNIIQDNIYGVDISPGAIDIARLRFWLSLVVDEETPEPLPNFEFKFVCANTLIPLDDSNNQLSLEKEINIDTLKNYMSKYYNAQKNTEKEDWKRRIENLLGIGKLSLEIEDLKSNRKKQLQSYEPFNPNHSAEFFDPSLMMGNSKFDILIGNPPYIKEYDNRNAFDGLRDKPYYIGKMDLWYYFACYGLDLLKDGGIESFIAQNNWITSFGAKKMRNKVLEDSKIKEFIDFGDYKVFENVGIQTMIYILEKTKTNSKYEVKYSKLENKDFDRKKIDLFLYDSKNTIDYKKHFSKIEKYKYLDKTIDFVDDEKDIIIEKILEKGKFKLTEKEVAQGIVFPQDYLNGKNNELLGNIFNIGDGIFALNERELNNLGLSSFEKNLIKPLYNTEQFSRYYSDDNNTEYLIYTDSSFKDISKIEDFPNIKKHLDKFKDVITSDNKPYGLHRARDERFFIGEKIIAVRKCDKPAFSYVDFDSYVSATFYVIKTDRLNQKFLTGLLNSKLIEFWLKNKGKMQGNNYQLDKEPLLNLPLIEANEDKQKEIIFLVDGILKITNTAGYNSKEDIAEKQKELEDKIDRVVYELYGLNEEEVRVVEESLV